MSAVRGDDLLPDAKCEKFCKALRGKTVELDLTGERLSNELLKLLKCQCKADGRQCGAELERYSRCHKSVMGSGAFEGKRNCGPEFLALFSRAMEQR